MKPFCIVHLSDLHIGRSQDPIFARVRNNLLKDLSEVLERNGLSVDAIAMTGDTIDKGDLGAYSLSSDFYNALTSSLNIDNKQILFVPGNHDIPRPISPIRMFLDQGDPTEFTDVKKFAENWPILNMRFRDYNAFVNEFTGIDAGYDLYGGDVRTVQSQSGRIKFLLINSSWTSIGNQDYERLRVGRWQLEKIAEKSNIVGPADLTIAMFHHPLNWFLPEEREMTEQFLRENSIDAVLHGHIHDRSINMTGNPDGNIFSLVTGIGYPRSDERMNGVPKVSDCRYSIYKFDVESGFVDVWLRSSLDNGYFGSDTKLYSVAKEDGHFSMIFKDIQTIYAPKPTVVESLEMDQMPAILDWVGRDNELKSLFNERLRAGAITGIGGQGKSFLAAEFLRRYTRESSSRFDIGVWMDCRELDSLHAKVIKLLDNLSGGVESAELFREEKLADTAERLVRHLQSRRTLVVFDNVDAYVLEDGEMVTEELRPFLDAILNNEHHSFVLFTCRNPLNDGRSAFCHVPLVGLGIEEGIEYFRRRGITLTGDNSETYAAKVIELTKGHPWWLGLIAGQISSRQDSFKQCHERSKRGGEVSVRAQIKQYFDTVWTNLNKDKKGLLRYLVEAPRPLLGEEIIHIVNGAPDKIKKTVDRIVRLGLLVPHEVAVEGGKAYQVHPLVREFIHEKYSSSQQRPFVIRVLYAFLPDSIALALFESMAAIFALNLTEIKTVDLIDAIETCLNSRNYDEALWLLEVYRGVLNEAAGHYHEFVSVATRILESIDWRAQTIVARGSGRFILEWVIRSTELMGDKRSKVFLTRYERLVKPSSFEQLEYLGLAAHMAWQVAEYTKALKLLDEHEVLRLKLGAILEPNQKHTRALALRDLGDLQPALHLFTDIGSELFGEGSYYGNIARCMQGLGKIYEAVDLLRKSLRSLSVLEDYNDKVNTGYAYLWLCEIMLDEGDINRAHAFYLLARHVWNEFAKSLLPRLSDVEHRLSDLTKKDGMTMISAREIEREFLSVEESQKAHT